MQKADLFQLTLLFRCPGLQHEYLSRHSELSMKCKTQGRDDPGILTACKSRFDSLFTIMQHETSINFTTFFEPRA
jgi:hypothetical protein